MVNILFTFLFKYQEFLIWHVYVIIIIINFVKCSSVFLSIVEWKNANGVQEYEILSATGRERQNSLEMYQEGV